MAMIYKGRRYSGFSITREDAEGDLKAMRRPMMEHFLKVLLFDDSRNREHWYKELVGCLKNILDVRLKPKNKIPKAKMVEDIYFGYLGNEEEAEARVRLLEGYKGKVYEDLYLEDGKLDYLGILGKWVEFVAFINEKFTRGEKETSVGELREVIGR